MLYHVVYSHESGFGWVAMKLPNGIHSVEELGLVQARICEETSVKDALVMNWQPYDGQEGRAMSHSKSAEERREAAVEIARRYGGIDGAHHKMWVIDQMCRELLGDDYEAFVARCRDGDDGPETYDYDPGIAP